LNIGASACCLDVRLAVDAEDREPLPEVGHADATVLT
jgi:hypothetical protein